MFGRFRWLTRDQNLVWLTGYAILVFALVAAYSNHFQNSFHFDNAHTIVNNAAIRDLRNIPEFFRDASTFSSLPSNQSYRPLVSTLLAIDYRLGGLQPFWFHLSIVALFVTLTLLLAYLLDQLLNGHRMTRLTVGSRWPQRRCTDCTRQMPTRSIISSRHPKFCKRILRWRTRQLQKHQSLIWR